LRTARRRTLLLRMVLPIHVRARKRLRTRGLQHNLYPRNTTTLHRLLVHNRSGNSRILLHPALHESRLEETTPRHIPTLHIKLHEKVLPRNNRPPIPETIPPSTSLPGLTRNNRRDLRTHAHRLPTNARRHAQHHGIHRRKPRRHRRVLVHVPHGLHPHTNLRSNVPLHTRHYAAER